MADDIKPKDVVVDFVSVLIEPAECIYLVVPTVCHRGVDETCGTLAKSAGHLGPVPVRRGFLHWRAGHYVGVIAGGSTGWSATRSEGHEGCGWACCRRCGCRCRWRQTAAKERLRGGGIRHRVGRMQRNEVMLQSLTCHSDSISNHANCYQGGCQVSHRRGFGCGLFVATAPRRVVRVRAQGSARLGTGRLSHEAAGADVMRLRVDMRKATDEEPSRLLLLR